MNNEVLHQNEHPWGFLPPDALREKLVAIATAIQAYPTTHDDRAYLPEDPMIPMEALPRELLVSWHPSLLAYAAEQENLSLQTFALV
jgi:hypothetical protein